MRRRDVGRGRRLRAGFAAPLPGGWSRFGGPQRIEVTAVRDPSAPHYGGAVRQHWKRIGRRPDASDRRGRRPLSRPGPVERPGRKQARKAPDLKDADVPERSGRGEQERPSQGAALQGPSGEGPAANRGDAEGLPSIQ